MAKLYKNRPMKSRGTRRRYKPKIYRPMKRNYSIHNFVRTTSFNAEVVMGNVSLTSGTLTTGSTGGYLTLTTPAATGVSFASFSYKFTLDGLPNLTEFSNLFDAYQIRKVVIRIIPLNNVSGTTVAGAPNSNPDCSGFIHYVIDHDDNNVPATSETGIDELRQMGGYKFKRLVREKGFSIVVKPRYAQTLYRTGVTSAYGQGDRNRWIDMANTDVPHYGVKGVFEVVNPNAANSIMYTRIETTYYIKCKSPR